MVTSTSSSADESSRRQRQLMLLRLSEPGDPGQPPALHCWSERGWQPLALDSDFVRAFSPQCEIADNSVEVPPLEFPEGARALLLLPGNWVWSGLESIPKAARRQNNAIGYMVEECLAEDVEDLHFVCQPRLNDLCSVYAIATDKMEALQSQIQRLGWPLAAVVPEYQLLDLLAGPADTGGALWLDGDRAHLWYRSGYGLSLRRGHLAPLLASLATPDDETETPCLQLLGAGEDDAMLVAELESQFPGALQRVDGPAEEALVADFKPARLANLMSGDYQLADDSTEPDWWLRPLKVAAACFIAQLLLFAAAGGYFQWRASGAEEQARLLFTELFPGVTPQGDLRRQIDGYVKRAGNSGGNFAGQMQLLSRAWGQHKGDALKLQSLRFDDNRGEMVVQLRAASLTDLDSFVGHLSEGGFRAELLAANELDEGVAGRIRLH